MIRIAHVINPVKVNEASDLYAAQPITFETMRIAREFAAGKAEVELLTVQYPEDHEIIPSFFRKLPDLKRSVLDIRSFHSRRKYPLIKDILAAAYEGTHADYLVYTNSDIALMPQFYLAVNDFIAQGLDALIINRRRVSRKFRNIRDIPLMWSEIGGPHPGFDCFVFHRNLYPKFILENVCVGVPFVEATLAYNLFALSGNIRLFTDKHLTVHIGMEVMPVRDKEYHRYNHDEFRKVFKQLRQRLTADKLPYSLLPFHRKVIKWGLNPAVFILPNMQIEAEGRWNKLKTFLNEIRWRWLEK